MSLQGLDRKSLQSLAKQHGVRANQATSKLLSELVALNVSAVIDCVAGGAEGEEGVADVDGSEPEFVAEEPSAEAKDEERTQTDGDQEAAPRPKVAEERAPSIEACAGEENAADMRNCARAPVSAKALSSPSARAPPRSPFGKSGTPSTETGAWRPRAMPDFKALHEKLGSSGGGSGRRAHPKARGAVPGRCAAD